MGCNMSFESHTILEHTNLAEIIKIKESKVYDEIMVNIVSDEINQALDSNDKKFRFACYGIDLAYSVLEKLADITSEFHHISDALFYKPA